MIGTHKFVMQTQSVGQHSHRVPRTAAIIQTSILGVAGLATLRKAAGPKNDGGLAAHPPAGRVPMGGGADRRDCGRLAGQEIDEE